MGFLDDYKKWGKASIDERKKIILECVRFYEEKTIEYIVSNLPKRRQKSFKHAPVTLKFTKESPKRGGVNFGDNVVYVFSMLLTTTTNKKALFFRVAQNTICAVFANLFSNTVSSPTKHTTFGKIAKAFLASITVEFAKGETFEKDMMENFSQILSSEMTQSK